MNDAPRGIGRNNDAPPGGQKALNALRDLDTNSEAYRTQERAGHAK
jgi:hypothetical protein